MAVATYIIREERDRRFALVAVQRAPIGMQVKVSKPGRSAIQNAAIHAALTDIADQLAPPPPPANTGEFHDVVWWKRRCTLGWLIETKQEREIIHALEGDVDRRAVHALVEVAAAHVVPEHDEERLQFLAAEPL